VRRTAPPPPLASPAPPAGRPPGLAINSSTGLISGTVANTASLTTPYNVTVTASDGTTSDSTSFTWTISALSVTNPGGNPLTFSATGQSLAYVLTQRTGTLTYYSVWDNYGGLGEKWLQSASGQWYFILAGGQLYRWDGGSGATGTLLGNVGSSYYADPTQLTSPPANQPHATFSFSGITLTGGTLTVTRDSAWVSSMVITVMVSDGTKTDSKIFDVFVTP